MKKRKLRARIEQLERDYDTLYRRFMEREEPTSTEKMMYGIIKCRRRDTPLLDHLTQKATWGWSSPRRDDDDE